MIEETAALISIFLHKLLEFQVNDQSFKKKLFRLELSANLMHNECKLRNRYREKNEGIILFQPISDRLALFIVVSGNLCEWFWLAGLLV